MRRCATSALIGLLVSGAHGNGVRSPAGADVQQKPKLTLIVNPNSLDVARKDGRSYFLVDVVAGSQFKGTVSGSISVSDPFNPDGVELTEGRAGRNLEFTLASGHRISESKSREDLTFRVRTSPVNPNDGIVIYSVFLNSSGEFDACDTPKQIKVRVVSKTGK